MKTLDDLPNYDVILFDTMNLAAIQYYSKLQLSYKGKPTGMLFGVVQAVHSLHRMYPSAKMIFLWEGYKSLRKSRCAEYKANREKKDNGFKNSLKDVKTALSLLPVEEVTHSGLEADDLAGYFCKHLKDKRILLVSNDRDWWEFVEEGRVDVYSRNAIHTYSDLQVKLGFPPERIGMWKILKGDESDNVAGIPRFPSQLALDLVRSCTSYKQFLEYPFKQSQLKWKNELQLCWDSVVERNAMLILYHPEWVVKKHLIQVKNGYKKRELLNFLRSRGMNSLVKKFSGSRV